MQYVQCGRIAAESAERGGFDDVLRAIAVDAAGHLLAVGDCGVVLYDPEGSPIRAWPCECPPHSVAFDAEGHALVGEVGQVELFDLFGQRLALLADPLRLGRVTAVAALADEWIVADADARRLRRYSRAGEHLGEIGADNRMQGFLIPNGVLDFALDAEGLVHAANPGKHRVERYTREGRLLGHIGRFDGRDPAGFAGCCNPTNLAVVGGEHVYVTEKAAPRAKVLDAQGGLVAVIATDAFDPGCKNMDLCVDARGRVHVVDTIRRAVLSFEPSGETASGR